MASLNNNRGLSLLGTLLAAFLLATTALSVSQLMAKTQRASLTSRELLLATALGREGIELVRALRDTNWFLQRSAQRHWTQGLCDADEFTLDAPAVRALSGVGDKDRSQLFLADNGEWVHAEGSHPTAYQRLLSVDCGEKDTSILVTSRVTWRGADHQDHEWQVRQRLYDWYF